MSTKAKHWTSKQLFKNDPECYSKFVTGSWNKHSGKKIQLKPRREVDGKMVEYKNMVDMAKREPITECIATLAFPLYSECHNEETIIRLERVVEVCSEKFNFGFTRRYGLKMLAIADSLVSGCINDKRERGGFSWQSAEKCDFEDRAKMCVCKLKIAIATHLPEHVKIVRTRHGVECGINA